MSIQRYECLGVTDKCNNGDYVLFSDHLEAVRQQLFHLLSTLADIRIALEVGDGPMLSELAGKVKELRTERDELLATSLTKADYMDKMAAARDAAVRDRDAAVEALRLADGAINEAQKRIWGAKGDVIKAESHIDFARAALAKIEGGRNGQDV